MINCFTPLSLLADTTLHIDPQEELRILESLDIDPLFYNDEHYAALKKNINALKKLYFLKTLKRGSIFMPNLQELLNESDIPNTFLYMAMVESKFLADSKSHKHAAGLWQFMPATAKVYNLNKNREVDERLDPIKSTKAAIEYLKYLHSRFKKWYLAAMAYNCGEARLAQALRKAGTDDLSVLLDDEKEYLPKETREYIKRILVAALLAHDKKIIKQNNKNHLFGFCSNKKLTKLYFRGGESLASIAFKIGVPYKKLKACNPHLIKNRLPKDRKMYYVYLPEDLAQKAKKRLKDTGESFVYYVQPNDTLFLISKRFNIKLSALRELNPHLAKHKVLKIGMPLTILGKPPKDLPKKSLQKEKEKYKIITYTTQKRTSLYEISLKFNNKLSTLKKLNPNIGKRIPAGTKLKVVVTEEKNATEKMLKVTFKTKPILDNNTTAVVAKKTNQTVSNLFEMNKTTKTNRYETNITHKKVTKTEQKRLSEENESVPRTDAQKPGKPVQFRYRTVTYRIEEGDYLEKIAMKLHMKAKEMMRPGNILILKIKEVVVPQDSRADTAIQE